MKPIASAIVISLAASGVAAVAAANNKKSQLRGGNANQQHRSLEGECVGVPNGQWRPTPGCHGAALCMNDEEFFLYPCNEEEGFLYDEARGGCAPKAEVKCNVGWESIGVEGDSAGDGEGGDREGEIGEDVSEEDAADDNQEETGGADADADVDTADTTDASDEGVSEEDTAGSTEEETGDADADADADEDTVDITDGADNTSDGIEETTDDGETAAQKEKRMCNTMKERTYFKACKKLHCVGLGDEPLEECKEMCRLQECTYEEEDEEDEEDEGN